VNWGLYLISLRLHFVRNSCAQAVNLIELLGNVPCDFDPHGVYFVKKVK